MTWMTAGLLSVRCTLDFELKIRKLQKCAKLIIKGGLVNVFSVPVKSSKALP